MGALVIGITAGILFIFWFAMVIGQKWSKDSRREEEEERKRNNFFEFEEDEFMRIHRD